LQTFEELLAEDENVPVEGWDSSWFNGRASEERPSWGYSRIIVERMATAHVALDIQTGGGEVLAQIPHPPTVLMATESWPPNVEIVRRNLQHVGARVVEVDDHADLPFPAENFDLVVSRHRTVTLWDGSRGSFRRRRRAHRRATARGRPRPTPPCLHTRHHGGDHRDRPDHADRGGGADRAGGDPTTSSRLSDRPAERKRHPPRPHPRPGR
jgi:hypothetical protein